jgi:monofunctional biosynthetic peptidoglycan transglycosylase
VRRVVLLVALGLFAVFVALAIQAWLEVATCDVASLARHAPARTSMMRQRLAEAAKAHHALAIDQRWVPYDRISPLLRRSVLVAEDDAFFSHDGLDWNEIKASAKRNVEAGHVVRGGSTITQQLARNLFLGSERSITRKLKEALLAVRIEHALEKRRIFELYLNEIEWGDGIFGAEAAAQRWFGVSAADLDPRQSALLAAIIINPRLYSPTRPSTRIERRVRLIASRLHRRGALDDDQYLLAIGEARPRRSFLQWLFGSPDSTPSPAPPPPDTLEAPPDSAL